MAASQRSQHEAFQELARVSKDKSNDSMQQSKLSTEQIDNISRIQEVSWSCKASNTVL